MFGEHDKFQGDAKPFIEESRESLRVPEKNFDNDVTGETTTENQTVVYLNEMI